MNNDPHVASVYTLAQLIEMARQDRAAIRRDHPKAKIDYAYLRVTSDRCQLVTEFSVGDEKADHAQLL